MTRPPAISPGLYLALCLAPGFALAVGGVLLGELVLRIRPQYPVRSRPPRRS